MGAHPISFLLPSFLHPHLPHPVSSTTIIRYVRYIVSLHLQGSLHQTDPSRFLALHPHATHTVLFSSSTRCITLQHRCFRDTPYHSHALNVFTTRTITRQSNFCLPHHLLFSLLPSRLIYLTYHITWKTSSCLSLPSCKLHSADRARIPVYALT